MLYTSNIATFSFHKVVRRRYSGEVSNLQYSYVKLYHDSVHQKLITSVHFRRVIPNIKRPVDLQSGQKK